MKKKIKDEVVRARRVKGFAFRDHTPEEVKGIKKYLETGDDSDLPESYKKIPESSLRY